MTEEAYMDPEAMDSAAMDPAAMDPVAMDPVAAARRDGALSQRNTDYLNLASVICAIGVMLIHFNSIFWTFSAEEGYWLSANIIENGFYCAVPIFYMISATTLLDYRKRYDTGTFFKKRIAKTVIPYVFWSMMGLLLKLTYLERLTLEEVSVSYVLTRLGEGSLVGYYWYFIPLFGIYLSIPLYAAVSDSRRKSVYTYVAVAAFVVCSLIPFVISVFDLDITTSLTVGVGAEYLIYVPVGYLLSHYETPKAARRMIYALGIAGAAMLIAGTYVLSMRAGAVVETFKGYTNVPVIMYAAAVFLFFRQYGNRIMKNRVIGAVIGFLRRYSFSIYLLHWFTIQLYERMYHPSVKTVFYRLILPFPMMVIIIVFTFLIRKIPVVKKLLP